MKCDFCSAPDPQRRYPCRDFDIPEVRMTSVGDFLACETCAAIIDANDREGLLLRSLQCYRDKHHLTVSDEATKVLHTLLRGFHAQFWASRV